MMMIKIGNKDYTLKMQRCHEYVEALEEEQKKIHVFQRELPLCLELVTQAIDSCRKELSGLSTSEHVLVQSECSERTTSECGGGGGGGGGAAVFEEFIPIKWNPSSSDEHESSEPNKDDGAEELASENNGDKKKSDWLRSVQLWNPSPDPQPKEDETTTVVVEVKRNCGAFQPFQKEKHPAVAADSQPLKAVAPTLTTTSSSTADTGGDKRESERHKQNSQMLRKQRRCWSPELHLRFLHALQQLGGSHVATPKQIRDLMKVDGLTNDEVKSHLQKYRLHTRRPATPAVTNGGGENPQEPRFMVVEGIWVPSHDAANNRVYAPVAVQPPQASPSEERSSRRCKSPTTSSSTHTAHLFPLS